MKKLNDLSFDKHSTRYSEKFKHQVCQEYLTGEYTKNFLARKYRIGGKTRILTWLRKYGYVEAKSQDMKKTNKSQIKEETKKNQNESEEIKRLKKQLEEQKFQTEMYSRMIDLAETEFGIPIRKK